MGPAIGLELAGAGSAVLAPLTVLLDSVHTAYKGDGKTLVPEALAPFLSFAHRARAEEAVMVLTHSEIRPPGYASTSEVASYIVEKLGGRREYAGLAPAAGVEFKTRYDDGLLHIRGYSGTSSPKWPNHPPTRSSIDSSA